MRVKVDYLRHGLPWFWLYTVGTGFRWKIKYFVKTDLSLDYGYDVEEQKGKLYGGTSLNF